MDLPKLNLKTSCFYLLFHPIWPSNFGEFHFILLLQKITFFISVRRQSSVFKKLLEKYLTNKEIRNIYNRLTKSKD